ncbi:hypothetical protein PRUPE_7G151900 [Prunus persica]|uniref:Uncharacterized protein n=1 Tax=Prunus persica TaxID=3760 RepID=M5WB26_PRUPE|nr:hypothetical protein PRUPE_7G151900 [Prunus persica]
MSSVDQIFLVHMYLRLFCVYPSFYLSINLSFRGLELSLAACSLCLCFIRKSLSLASHSCSNNPCVLHPWILIFVSTYYLPLGLSLRHTFLEDQIKDPNPVVY